MRSAKFLITETEQEESTGGEEAWLWQREREKKHYEQLQGTCRSNLRCQAAVAEVERCQDEAPGSFTTTTRDNWHILHHLIYSHQDVLCDLQLL